MKYFYFIACSGFLLFTIISCKKTITQHNQLTGKWSIVNDSTSTDESCNGCFNSSNFLGGKSDYYNFTDQETLYIGESGVVDTAIYSTTTGNRVTIETNYLVNGSGVFIDQFAGSLLPLSYPIKNLTYSISNMTEHTLTLSTSGTASFSGFENPPIKYIEIINLKK